LNIAAILIVVTAVAYLTFALSHYGLHGWVVDLLQKAHNKNPKTKLPTPSQYQRSVVIEAIAVSAVLCFIANAVYRAKHWSRWGVIGVWFVGTLTGIPIGMTGLIYSVASAPIAIRLSGFIAGACLLAAAVLVNIRPASAYLAAQRPAGTAPRRGLFGPIPPKAPRPARGADVVTTKPANAAAPAPSRSKTKVRADNEAVAKGADLARSRAKAAKSRRPGA
jgi:hypothetical protein